MAEREGEELTNRNPELSSKNIFIKYCYNLLFFISLGGGERFIQVGEKTKVTPNVSPVSPPYTTSSISILICSS